MKLHKLNQEILVEVVVESIYHQDSQKRQPEPTINRNLLKKNLPFQAFNLIKILREHNHSLEHLNLMPPIHPVLLVTQMQGILQEIIKAKSIDIRKY